MQVGNTASCLTLTAYGKTGLNVGIGVAVATIAAPPIGRYKIWGWCRHALDDGLRIKVGASPLLTLACPGLTQLALEPPLVVQLDGTQDIVLETNAATGVTGLAAGTLVAQRQCEHLSEHAC